MLAWQNKTSFLKQPKQVNHVIKKKIYHSRCFQQVNHTNIVLAQQIYTLGIKRVPPFFLVVCSETGDVRKSLPYQGSLRKNGHPLKTINHDQFWTKYSDTLTDQPLSKRYRVKLDLDGLRKARYPRITKRATKRMSVLSLCCDQRQQTFVNLGLF